MDVRTLSAKPGFHVTSDAYYPGWRASIDGKDTELFRADYSIRGVMVPAGGHVVEFNYKPRSVYVGAAISILSLLAMGTIALTHLFHRRSDSKPS